LHYTSFKLLTKRLTFPLLDSIVKKVVGPDGQVQLKTEIINVTINDKERELSGAHRTMLKESLRQSISAKRAADRLKRMQNQPDEDQHCGSGKEESEAEEEILSDEPETDEDADEFDDDEEEISQKNNIFADEAAEDDMSDDDEQGKRSGSFDCGSDDDNSAMSFRRIQSSTSVTNVNFCETSKNSNCTGSVPAINLSFSPNLDRTQSQQSQDLDKSLTKNIGNAGHSLGLASNTHFTSDDNMDELIGLCSGKFTNSLGDEGVSRSLFGKADEDSDDDDDDPKAFSRIIPMEDDDDEEDAATKVTLSLTTDDIHDEEKENRPAFFNASRTQKPKCARLFISDDEDEDEEENDDVDGDDAVEEMHEEEKEFLAMKDFFENEAELSGSELGSGDEREEGEDDWEVEEGDKEVFDESVVRDELGRVHMKTILDQDQREVRLIQEMFLEDGDLHSDGGGRQRQFRWKSAEGDEADAAPTGPRTQQEEEEDASEDQEEANRRKMRTERDKWIQEQKEKNQTLATADDLALVMNRTVRTVKVNTNAKMPVGAQQSISISPKKQHKTLVTRGSFLRRSEKNLSTIATLTKSVVAVQAPRAGANFVFASVTPERPPPPENNNRKHKQLDSSSQKPAAKKAKTTPISKSIFSYF